MRRLSNPSRNGFRPLSKKLLDFARRGGSQKTVGDLRQVVHHAVDLVQPLAAKRNNMIKADLPDSPAECELDFNQMQQVMMNLIDNAVDASQGGDTIEINLAPAHETNHWVLDVIDHGEGIDPASQSSIF